MSGWIVRGERKIRTGSVHTGHVQYTAIMFQSQLTYVQYMYSYYSNYHPQLTFG